MICTLALPSIQRRRRCYPFPASWRVGDGTVTTSERAEMTRAVFGTAAGHHGTKTLDGRPCSCRGRGPRLHHPECVSSRRRLRLEAACGQHPGREGSWSWSRDTWSSSGSGTNLIPVNKSLKLYAFTFSGVKGGGRVRVARFCGFW